MLIVPANSLLAFFEGFALILSPCILPILPLILATSIVGSRSRAFLIILGFILSFTFFALLSRKILALSGIQQDTLHYIAYGILFLLGLVLIIPYLDERFARMTTTLASSAEKVSSGKKSQGMLGALFVGILIGVIWTPCAGPILAAALVQIITAHTDIEAVITVIAFGIGSAIPMLMIALFSQQLIQRIRAISKHAIFIRRVMGIIIIIFALFGLFGFNFAAWIVTPASASELQDAPKIEGIKQWFNSPPLTLSELKGKVVMVDFWTYSCINCIRTLPHTEAMYKKYKDKGFVVIGVHSPEYSFEANPKNVGAAIKDFGITYPVAMDNDLMTWKNFNAQYWPTHYLINREGKIVYIHYGEGDYNQTENNIRILLGLIKTTPPELENSPSTLGQTPETYLGYARTKNFSSPESITKDKLKTYSFPGKLERNQWALNGAWTINSDHIVAEQKNAELMLYFTAGKVYLVLGSKTGQPITVSLKLNGTSIKSITVNQHQLYELLRQPVVRNGVLEINANTPGLEAYAFTFGK